MIRLRRLRLSGPSAAYEVNLVKRDERLGVIAGQIHTGKTTVLEFIDYCLGSDEHPTHPEVARSVRSAALELSVDGKLFTIERPTFASGGTYSLASGGTSRGDRRNERPAYEPGSGRRGLSPHGCWARRVWRASAYASREVIRSRPPTPCLSAT